MIIFKRMTDADGDQVTHTEDVTGGRTKVLQRMIQLLKQSEQNPDESGQAIEIGVMINPELGGNTLDESVKWL